MRKHHVAACLMATALAAAPALAQTDATTGTNLGVTSQNGQLAPVNTPEFVRNATIGGLFEVQSSQLALRDTQDRDVRQFADRMIHDHQQANDKLKSLASGQTVPTSLDPPHQQMLTELGRKKGSDFVDSYRQMQVAAHRQAINLFQSYAQTGDNPQLKQFAQQTVPTLQEHLRMAEAITVANTGNGNRAGNAQTASAGPVPFLHDESAGTWRASKVIGLNVYNEQNQKVGDISEVLFDRNGRVEGVVIGIGGFLGLGQRDVAVPYNALHWSMTPVNANTAANDRTDAAGAAGNPGTAGSTGSAGLGANPGDAPTVSSTGGSRTAAYPDHAVLPNASRDQLSNAPQFNYGERPR